jgi:rubredoxin
MKYQCKACNYQATQKGDLNTHVKSKHIKQNYPCPDCA